MATERVDFTGVKETLLYTLYYRALDQRSKSPVVGDRWAPEVVERIEGRGLRIAKWGASGRFTPLLRASRLDDWTRQFLAHHSEAIVLHLGCGLDSRAFRIDPPPGVEWFDLDYPEVIELRTRLLPAERDHYRMIAASVTDPDWLTGIPADRPVLVVAEGLMMYLTQTELTRLLERLTDHFANGELVFDASGALQAKMTKLFKWTLDDPHDPERWNSALTLLEQVPLTADFQRIPPRRYRILFQVMNQIPATRKAMTLLRYGLRCDRPAEV